MEVEDRGASLCERDLPLIMFRNRIQLRRWAARMLAVWLCGVAIGVAHACFAPAFADSGEPQARNFADGGAATQRVEHAHASHHAEPDGPVAHHGSPSKPNCQDFCAKSAVAIPPLKTALDDLGHALPPPATAMVVAPPAPVPDPLLPPRRDGAAAPPITIAFLRLAL
ncbi:MAG: hypothetical protein KIT60_19895 [Burkholderiaceae bacterium]|nr:hypothetical protein [Burkholderiaceae bacterium]